MSKILIKVANEIGVGLTTIVEHLHKKGFEIDSKPTAKVTDEMYSELIREFSGSISDKEKADQLLMQAKQAAAVPEKPKPTTTPKINLFGDEPVTSPAAKKESKPKETVEPPKEKIKAKEEIIEAKADEADKPKLKVVGKIDLKKGTKKTKKEEVTEEIKEEKTEIPVIPQDVPETEELLRIEAPTLKGLKILGKIDQTKLTDPAKKKKEEEVKKPQGQRSNQGGTKTGQPNSNADAEAKRKRKRKKVPESDIPSNNNNQGQNRPQTGGGDHRRPPPRRDDGVKEVSQKEVEEKIKQTMARLNIGGKNKRQKIRRDKREFMREKRESQEVGSPDNVIQLTEFVTVSELASLMDVPVTDVITTCLNMGIIVSINQRLEADVIEILAEEFNFKIDLISLEEEKDADLEVEEDDPAELLPRAPIVTVMGHVDHGKTSLLDYIRNTNVVSGEAGGITQHIGAYEVQVGPEKKRITFLDTPGHEAFTAMRARGAKVTDIAVIIVAADDRIMPQTKEAISHAQAANVPMIFAINKIDKPGADAERIKNELSQMNILVEEWGGKFQSQDISAKNGTGIEQLLDKILLEAEVLDLKANPNKSGSGTVIEASLDKGRGYVTKLLIQNGTLTNGDMIVAGEFAGKIKAMFNERGVKLKSAGPSAPVMVLGLTGAPQAGEKFKALEDETEARALATKRQQISREQTTRASKRISLDEIGRRLAIGDFKELKLIVKGDVDGSVEALSDSLIKLSLEKVQVSVIHRAVGQIIESDILLASASDAIVIGFQVRPSPAARTLAEREGVEVKTYSIIYEAIEEIKLAIEGLLEPTIEENITGSAKVQEVYKISKVGTVAGCVVASGKIMRNNHIRVIRDGIVIYPTKEGAKGEIQALKRFKDDVKEVKDHMECGISIKNFDDLKEGDIIEAYEISSVKQNYAQSTKK